MADRPRAHRLMRLLAVLLLAGSVAQADTIRLATFNVALSRDYAGQLIRDVEEPDAQVAQIVQILREVAPDILLINEFDRDPGGRALQGFRDLLAAQGLDYPHIHAGPVNSGQMTGLDLNGNTRLGDPEDAQGWGRWPGHRAMALLSRYPIETVRDFRTTLWADIPQTRQPPTEPQALRAIQHLSSKSHWDIAVRLPGDTVLHILAAHSTPPVFDGPDDRNGRRNADEIDWFVRYLNGAVLRDDEGTNAPLGAGYAVVMGTLNADPFDGDAVRGPLLSLLAHPRLQDPAPDSAGAVEAGIGGANDTHRGPAALDTADWRDDPGPGNLRVDYVLPDARLQVRDAGVFWPATGAPFHDVVTASDHRLVWVDVSLP